MSKLEDLMEKYTKTEDKDNAQFIMFYDKDGKQYITLIRDYYKIRDGFIDLIQKEMNEYLKEKESYEKKGVDVSVYEGYLMGLNRALALLLIAEKENSNR